MADTAALLNSLSDLTAEWLDTAGTHQARADRLGNCAAGKEAYGDALMLRRCADQLAKTVNTAVAELLDDAQPAGRYSVKPRPHQALGICWCHQSHSIAQAFELNPADDTAAQ